MIAVWESDISATFLIFRFKCSTDSMDFLDVQLSNNAYKRK